MHKHYPSNKIIAGCDEAGRGCLAGPVVAAAVILPKKFKNSQLNDSKLMSKKKRDILKVIIENESICYAVGIASVKEIDKFNILNASFLAMHRAIKKLSINPEMLIIDGNTFSNYKSIKHKCIIKGDQKYLTIAAAAVLAKTYRDNIMMKLDAEAPIYQWGKNKGYPTKEHRKRIQIMGVSKHHRKSFKLLTLQ